MMERFKELPLMQKAIAVVFCLFVGVVVWAMLSVPDLPTKEEAQQMAQKAKIMLYENQSIKEEKNGRVIWELKTKRTEMNMDTNSARCEDIVAKFYMEDGTVVDGTAKAGGYNGKTKDVFLEGDAVIVTNDGRKLTADKITWLADAQKAIAEGRAHLTKK